MNANVEQKSHIQKSVELQPINETEQGVKKHFVATCRTAIGDK